MSCEWLVTSCSARKKDCMTIETRKGKWLTSALLLWLTFVPLAQAFYNPSTGRWLGRDPINEKGFRISNQRKDGFVVAEEKNLVAFVGNDCLNRTDKLGLTGWGFLPFPKDQFHRCGSVVERGLNPKEEPGIWDQIGDIFQSKVCPHVFVILPDGTRLSHGGSGDGEDHFTARTMPIYVNKCMSCSKFNQCMKDSWPDPSQYNWYSNNCNWAVKSAVEKCGGVYRLPMMY